jgi:hypothetical protein
MCCDPCYQLERKLAENQCRQFSDMIYVANARPRRVNAMSTRIRHFGAVSAGQRAAMSVDKSLKSLSYWNR